jgi:hypothetical protein
MSQPSLRYSDIGDVGDLATTWSSVSLSLSAIVPRHAGGKRLWEQRPQYAITRVNASVSESVLQRSQSKVVGIPSHVIIDTVIISSAFTGDKWGFAWSPHHHPFADGVLNPFVDSTHVFL